MFKKITTCFLLLSLCGFSQNLDNKFPDDDDDDFEFKVMPYVNYNRDLKLMIGALPLAMYKVNKKDTISPKSLAGVVGVYTTNKSYFALGFTKMFLFEDKWRLRAYLISGNLNSQIFFDDIEAGGFYDFTTTTTQFGIDVKRYIFGDLYGGLGVTLGHYKSTSEDIEERTDTNQNSIDMSLLSDKRDDIYYPTTGHKIRTNFRIYPDWFGNDDDAQKILLTYNKYFPKKKNVIATRFYGEFGLGDVKFEQQVVIGGKDIRGYSQSKYRGDGLIAIQGEYRYNFKERFGAVGFVGLSTIYGSINEDHDWRLYPGIGVGGRYRVFKKSKFNIGIDVAVGREDWGLYFRIGEAF